MKGDFLKRLQEIHLSDLRRFRTEMLGVLILAALTFFFFKVVYSRDVRKVRRAEAQEKSIRADIVRIRAEIEASKRLRKELEAAETTLKMTDERLRNLKRRLPSDKHISRILAEISEDGARRGIHMTSIKPGAPEDRGRITRLPFSLEFKAGFTSFGDYLERIENLPRIMIVDNFLLEAGGDGAGLLGAQVYLSAYILSYGQ